MDPSKTAPLSFPYVLSANLRTFRVNETNTICQGNRVGYGFPLNIRLVANPVLQLGNARNGLQRIGAAVTMWAAKVPDRNTELEGTSTSSENMNVDTAIFFPDLEDWKKEPTASTCYNTCDLTLGDRQSTL